MLDQAIAALCSAYIVLGSEGVVTVVAKVEQPLKERVLKQTLPNNGTMFEPESDRWHITIKFPHGLILFEQFGPPRWRERQIVNFDGEMCGTPFVQRPNNENQ